MSGKACDRINSFPGTGHLEDERDMRGSVSHRVALLVFLSLMVTPLAQADTLTFSFTDPVGDHLQLIPVRQLNPPAGVVDIVGLVFKFDNVSGDFEIILTASPANPFVGGFRINVNVFNPDTGTTAVDPAFFTDQLNDFFLGTPSTVIILTGTNARLLAWKVGDRVAPCEGASFVELGPCQGGLGLPDNVLGFGTGVISFTGPPGPFVPVKGTDLPRLPQRYRLSPDPPRWTSTSNRAATPMPSIPRTED